MHCVLHGVPLPDLGSFEYQLLEAALARKRAEKLEFARLLAELLGPAAGLETKAVNLLLTSYAETLSQVRYNYQYTPVHVRVREKQLAAKREDDRLMKKVAAMTVPGSITDG